MDREKIDKPTCYVGNNETYPLCVGITGCNDCKKCNLYENMEEQPYPNC